MSILDQFRLDGQVAVVTGSGRGIGEGIAVGLAEAGAAVVVAARRTNEIEAVAEKVQVAGGQALARTTDFLEVDQIEALADAAVAEFGKLTIWVNNVGGAQDRTARTILGTPEKAWDNQIDLNLKSVWAGAKAANRAMGEEGGVIVNISSSAATKPSPMNGPYAAAKFGVNSLTMTLAAELAPRVRVVGISPGGVPTEVLMEYSGLSEQELRERGGANVPLGRMGEPEDIAAAVVYLTSPAASWVTGTTLSVTGGS